MKFIKLFLPLIFLIFALVVNGRNSGASKNIPIIGWYGILPNQSTVDRFKEQEDSGITQNLKTYSNHEEVKKALDAASQTGIKIYIYSPEILTNTKEYVLQFKDHPALAGYFLKDEPSTDLFRGLKKLKDEIISIDSTHLCYINLLPMYATVNQLGSSNYREYIQKFVSEVDPTVLSFDYYPIILNTDETITLRDTWFDNLEIISEESKRKDIPFWAFVLATEHNNYPLPTLGQLRLQAFVNLAYGAQGIQYFTYWTPPGNTIEKFRNGAIDFNGNKTPTYYLIQELNKQIKDLSFVFLDSKVLFKKHVAKDETERFRKNKFLSRKISKIETNGNDIFVSYLNNNKKNYLVIVNKNFQKEISISIDAKVSSLKQVISSSAFTKLNRGRNNFKVDAGNILIISLND